MRAFPFLDRDCRGFTLLEVLIALVVAVVGVLGIIQLSGVLLQTISDSERRAVAMTLAERTIEDLRGFERLQPSPASSESAFTEIITTVPSPVAVSTGTSSMSFDIGWNVTDYIVSGGVISAFTSGAVTQRFKEVTVNVSWDQPTAGSLSLSSIIAAISDDSALLAAAGDANIGGEKPKVEYNPGEAPDVIAVDVGDGKFKETTKPLPEVEAKNESTVVRFETITYDNTDFQLVQEDFVTVNCFCVLDTSGATITTPAYKTFLGATNSDSFEEHYGTYVSGATGTVKALGGSLTQSEYCDRCCANHHDVSSPPLGIKYKSGASVASGAMGDHEHYTYTTSGATITLGGVAGHGDDYVEACRFKRIDGIYRLVPDWKAIEINVFEESYLTSGASSGLASYVEYIKDRVHYELYDSVASLAANANWTASAPSISPSPDYSTTTGASNQLLSRTIYIDDFSHDTALLSYLDGLSAASVAERYWLEYIPFNEINTTLLSDWTEGDATVAEVTRDIIDNVEDPGADYYGTFSRGLVTAISSSVASTAITAFTKDDNTGILGNEYANPSSYKGEDNKIIPSPTELSGSLTVTVNECAVTCYISGVIKKNYPGNNPMNFNNIDFGTAAGSDVRLTLSPSALSCSFGLNTGTQISFSCQIFNSGTYTVTIDGGATFLEGDADGVSDNGEYTVVSPETTDLEFTLSKP